MVNLSLIIWITLLAGLAAFWWYSDKVKQVAMLMIKHHCRDQGLQLLDQSLVIRGLWIVRDAEFGLCIRRRYQFEFTSTGQERYKGILTMFGRHPSRLELQPHIMPESQKEQ
ncbi:MAG: DUF3301 domain-containing protein [Pseudohongiellaceae bacterium]